MRDQLLHAFVHGPERVAAGTRERVLQVIGELGFVRNGSASSLRAGQGRLVGLMTTDNLTEVLMIQEALRAGRPGAAQITVPTQGSLQQALPKEQRPQLPA